MIAKVFQQLTSDAEQIRNTDPQSLHTMEVGDEFRQGDLRIIRLPDNFAVARKRDLKPVEHPISQLAPGNTQGSRHILQNTACCEFYSLVSATPLDGPIVVTKEANAITHPEHGDVVNLPAGCYAFPGQRAFAEELRRTAD